MKPRVRCGLSVVLLAGMAVSATAQDLTDLSLEDLMNLTVTSVSKKAQSLNRTPAAAFVLTQEDIRNSGMTNLPDLLRLVPGVNVARITANTWAISIRGFNDRYSGKVLVLIDGRSLYSVEFSGVFWDEWSVPLEDIDRIEVIRGPGGTVWGANAMNGVVNIITKHTEQTQGGLASLGSGSQDSAQAHVRYGGSLGTHGAYRAFGRYFNVEDSTLQDGAQGRDGWTGRQAGFRADFTYSNDTLLLEGDLYSALEGQTVTTVVPSEGFQTRTFNEAVNAATRNLLGKWTHGFANGSEASVQLFFSDVHRDDLGHHDNTTGDIDTQYRFSVGKRHDIVAGAGFRATRVRFTGPYDYHYDQTTLLGTLANTFVQDEISFSKAWSLTLGSKFERNNFTHFEFEPSAQLLWSPNDTKAAWFSVARAIRQPSFLYTNARIDSFAFPVDETTTGLYQYRGSPNAQAERVLDFEAGYRTKVGKKGSLDVAAFRSVYKGLASIEPGAPFFQPGPQPLVIFPAYASNLAGAHNYGGEVSAAWQLTSAWRLNAGYSFLKIKARPYANSLDTTVPFADHTSPKHQWQLRSSLKVRRNVDWDAAAYYTGSIHNAFPFPDTIAAYTRVDTRIAWRPNDSMELSVTGQNLLTPRHLEFPISYQVYATSMQRSIFGKIVWRF